MFPWSIVHVINVCVDIPYVLAMEKLSLYVYTLYVSVLTGTGFPSARSYYPNHYPGCIIHDIIIPNACVNVASILDDFGISFVCQFRSVI